MRTPVCTLLLILASGCATTVATFDEGRATVSSRGVVAEQTIAADGTRTTKIDTQGQSVFNKFAETFNAIAGGLAGKAADSVQYDVGGD